MRSNGHLSILLIEGNEICRQILTNHISTQFPNIEVYATTTPDEALRLLEEKKHDLVVCDALLAREERIKFIQHMCAEGDPVVIVITADTDLHKDTLPSNIKDVCVQHVTYKPVDLNELMRKIEEVVEGIDMRKGRVES